jgi:hypothetical protein
VDSYGEYLARINACLDGQYQGSSRHQRRIFGMDRHARMVNMFTKGTVDIDVEYMARVNFWNLKNGAPRIMNGYELVQFCMVLA